MAAKSLKIEKNEDFIQKWQEEVSLWDVFSESYKDRNAKAAGMKRLMETFDMTGKDIRCDR